MGINQNAKDKNIIINQKEKRSELNIYTCGNAKQIKSFNKNEIIGKYYVEQDLDFYEEKHPNNDWYFNFYLKELNDELIDKILNNVISNYRYNKTYKNNIILILFDKIEKNKDDVLKIKIILDKFDKMHKIYKPILLFAFKKTETEMELEDEDNVDKNEEEEEKNILDNIIQENKYDKYLTKKYIEVVYYNENNYSNIIGKINSIYCYYNNIGDLFTIFDEMIKGYHLNNNKKNKIKYKATFNILVIGRPGSGKSTLINILLNRRKAREGIGESVTQIVSKYVHDKYPLAFEDTPGFENAQDLEKIIYFINTSNNIFKQGKNKFHLVLYLINSSNERTFIGEEVKLIQFIENQIKIPIFFVCTRSRTVENARDFEEVVKMNLWQNFGEKTNLINHIYFCHLLNEKDGIYKRFGIDNLLNGIQKYYRKVIENKEKELFSNFEIEINKDINESLEDTIFLSGLKSSKNFENYLNEISLKLIEEYEYFTYQEELKGEKNKASTNGKLNKINELLIDHLAMELDGKTTGNIFIKKNIDLILNNIAEKDPLETSIWCLKQKSQDEILKNITISDEDIKKSVRITKEFGFEAKKEFLNYLRSNNEFESYLKNILKDYKEAIEALTKLVGISEE